MSTEDHPEDAGQPQDTPVHPPTGPAAMAIGNKKRPRLDLNVEGGRERKRGKSMFGILLGTLNKAKIEDKERNASEAAKKRHLTEQRLQNKLRKETDSVRRAEEAKKDKTVANRKEEELQLKDSIYKLRRTRLPLLASFLLTSDNIASEDTSLSPNDILSNVPRTHPPPLYYLPAILTPAQEEFIARRKAEVQDAAQKEWSAFRTERSDAIEEIKQLRQRVVEEEARKKAEQELAAAKQAEADMDTDTNVADDTTTTTTITMEKPLEHDVDHDIEMDVDVPRTSSKDNGKDGREPERKEESVPMQGDDDDAVEY